MKQAAHSPPGVSPEFCGPGTGGEVNCLMFRGRRVTSTPILLQATGLIKLLPVRRCPAAGAIIRSNQGGSMHLHRDLSASLEAPRLEPGAASSLRALAVPESFAKRSRKLRAFAPLWKATTTVPKSVLFDVRLHTKAGQDDIGKFW